jgi:GMP synthase (glutamine-hydrolysing)
MHDKILILDFGAQYTQLIARRVREAKVYCEIHPCDVTDSFVRDFGAKGVILSGSYLSAYEESNDQATRRFAQGATPACSRTSRICAPRKATACSRCG